MALVILHVSKIKENYFIQLQWWYKDILMLYKDGNYSKSKLRWDICYLLKILEVLIMVSVVATCSYIVLFDPLSLKVASIALLKHDW
jgi:hypothetical protein